MGTQLNTVTKVVETAQGFVAWRETPLGVAASTLPRGTREEALAAVGATAGAAAEPESDSVARALVAFYAGEPADLDAVPLDLGRETAFQAAVRQAVRAIPRGETRSYGDVARAAGSPEASRAVGQVMARNPVPPFVPCHRVIGSGGGLHGFGGGLDLKRSLLQSEGCSWPVS